MDNHQQIERLQKARAAAMVNRDQYSDQLALALKHGVFIKELDIYKDYQLVLRDIDWIDNRILKLQGESRWPR